MLQVDQLSKTFKVHSLGGKEILGVPPCSFSVEEGKSLALSAPSGRGKSSILKCIYRSYLPSSGRILLQSRSLGPVDLAQLDEHDVLTLREEEMGYVTQFLRVIPRLSAIEVVADPLCRRGVKRAEAEAEAERLLRCLKIPEPLLEASPITFSGGEQQRVNIARALIARPRLLLLDEPTASLDRESVERVMDMLNDLKASGSTMLMIFHDKELMYRMADEVMEL